MIIRWISPLVIVLCSLDLASAAAPPPPATQPGASRAAELAPVLTVEAESGMVVTVLFVNGGDKSVFYPVEANGKGIQWMFWKLSKDGETLGGVPAEERHWTRAPTKEEMRELKPGESLTIQLSLRKEYGNLAPGLYRLQLYYITDSDWPKLGGTPLSLHNVLYVQVK